MGNQRILGHQLFGDPPRQVAIHPAPYIYLRQFLVLKDGVVTKLLGFAGKVSLFGKRHPHWMSLRNINIFERKTQENCIGS
jgi:hypothetical protein